ncbi:caspase-like isoform X2 [Culicoides brevitarsis]|uniref:caspase-like isoform X2 n=1 Tax=Culicoides brevitarsis TaxID=469753 RepID=UPI00307C363E
MFSACVSFVRRKVCCKMAGNKEVIYELNLPLKAIVFNHTEYDKETLTPRTGDAGEQLVDCLRNDMQITDIDHKHNLTKMEVVTALIKVAQEGDKYAGLIICISSHGELEPPYGDYNEIIHARDMPYAKDELWKHFETQEAWKDKPILIFIQACRGADPTPGIRAYSHDVDERVEMPKPQFTVPKYPNLFVMNASQPGTVSFRWDDTTPFVEALIDVLRCRATEWDLVQIATHVCHKVAMSFEACDVHREGYECSLQMPCFETTLTRKFYFPVRETAQQDVELETYKLQKKGLAMIFLYDYEGTDLQERSCVTHDEELLEETFEKLNFDVEIHRNLGFNELIGELSDSKRFKDYDLSFVLFSGYGEKDELILTDANIGVNELWQSFLADKCPELQQKPKIFVISALPYTHEDPSVIVEGVSGKFDKLNVPRNPSQNVTECRKHGAGIQNIPDAPDISMTTMPARFISNI